MNKLSASFTRPAAATVYAAGKVVSNDGTTTALMEFKQAVTEDGGRAVIVGARLTTNQKLITPRFAVHLICDPTVAVAGDNANHKELWADRDKRCGSFDLPAMSTPPDTAGSDISCAHDFNLAHPVRALNGRSVYAHLRALDGFTASNTLRDYHLELWFAKGD